MLIKAPFHGILLKHLPTLAAIKSYFLQKRLVVSNLPFAHGMREVEDDPVLHCTPDDKIELYE